jgi:RHS repeat-associated protein
MVHVDGGTTRTEYYLYDGPRPIQRRSEGTATSNIDREYFSGGEKRWNTGTGAWVNHHFTRDHLGSVREVLDSSGTLLARYDYTPYGERQTRYEASGYSSDVGFTGHFHLPSPVSGQSEILLAHYRAYDPVLGRWLSQDPIREAGGINLYGYVGGNVAGALDLWGLAKRKWVDCDTKGFRLGIDSWDVAGGQDFQIHVYQQVNKEWVEMAVVKSNGTYQMTHGGRVLPKPAGALPAELRKEIRAEVKSRSKKLGRALGKGGAALLMAGLVMGEMDGTNDETCLAAAKHLKAYAEAIEAGDDSTAFDQAALASAMLGQLGLNEDIAFLQLTGFSRQ